MRLVVSAGLDRVSQVVSSLLRQNPPVTPTSYYRVLHPSRGLEQHTSLHHPTSPQLPHWIAPNSPWKFASTSAMSVAEAELVPFWAATSLRPRSARAVRESMAVCTGLWGLAVRRGCAICDTNCGM